MKILHLCLANFYIDNYSYQENMLPKFHKRMGLEVEIIASLLSFDENGKECILKKGGKYINEYNIPVTRLEYLNSSFSRRLCQYKGTYKSISNAKPDIIFIHGCQFLDMKYVVKYAKLHPNIKVYVDNHSDLYNSAKNFLSKFILHRIIWRYCAHSLEPYTEKFYGVLPARVDFLKHEYKLPKEKVQLLVMGADDEKVQEAKNSDIRKKIREMYDINPEDFLIITGGKIDNLKRQILLLMQAVKQIDNKNIRLLVFGSIINEMKDEVKQLVDGKKIQYIGWINSEDNYKYFSAADLIVFPCGHSVLWEQVVGLGIPMVVKYWKGIDHVDLGGNCKFLYNDSTEEIYSLLINLVNDKEELNRMRSVAENKGMRYFSYKDISSRAIELNIQL